jgi:hypothetical protein
MLGGRSPEGRPPGGSERKGFEMTQFMDINWHQDETIEDEGTYLVEIGTKDREDEPITRFEIAHYPGIGGFLYGENEHKLDEVRM